jgi:spermidine/putrescine transport system permease protein
VPVNSPGAATPDGGDGEDSIRGGRRRGKRALRPHVSSETRIGLLQLAPIISVYLLFFVVPLLLLVAYSFFRPGLLTIHPDFRLDAYVTALTDPLFYRVLVDTVVIGLATATVCVLLAYPFAYIANLVIPHHRNALLFLVLVTLFAGYLARIYAWRTLLGAEGVVNSLLLNTGLVSEPLRFLLYSRFAVTIALLSIYLPFAIVPLSNSMQNVGRDTIDAARDLGAGRLTTFRTVTFPLTYQGFRAAFLFCFLLVAGDYVTPSLVGGPDGVMVGIIIRDQFFGANNWPLGAALAVLTVVCVLLVFAVIDRLARLLFR